MSRTMIRRRTSIGEAVSIPTNRQIARRALGAR